MQVVDEDRESDMVPAVAAFFQDELSGVDGRNMRPFMHGADAETFEEALDISLVRGDLLYRLQRKVGLIPPGGLGVARRALFWSMFTWLPIAVWAWYIDRALPLLGHFGIQAMFLAGLPLFIIADGLAHDWSERLWLYFIHSGLVREAEMPQFRAALDGIVKLRDATLPWVCIFGVMVAVLTISDIAQRYDSIIWAVGEEGAAWRLSFGAVWFLYVGRPIFVTMLLGWLWRLILLTMLFLRIAKLDLALVPTHPDHMGGLGILEHFPKIFAPVVLACAMVVAGKMAHDVIYKGVYVESLEMLMIAFVILALAVFLSPQFVFIGPLVRAKKRALLDYGVLINVFGKLVHERWIEGKDTKDHPLLGAFEIGCIADTILLYQTVKGMRPVLLGKTSVIPILLAAVVPMLAVLALKVPIRDILSKLIRSAF